MAIKGEISGIEEVLRNLQGYGIRADQAIDVALNAAINDIAGRADELVPIDEGILAGSQDIQGPSRRGKTFTATISYGGPAEAYALVQHERLDYKHRGGRQAKYLEQPFVEEVSSWPEGFKDRLIRAGMDIQRR